MIPLRDNIPSRTVPLVNYAMIAACTLVFFAQLADDSGGAKLIERYGMIPARVKDPSAPVLVRDVRVVPTVAGGQLAEYERPAAPAGVPAWLTVVTCIFLHGGWMHFLGNMWFLFIFGDNVEDRFGHFGYLLLYLGCGVAASLAHLLTNAGSTVPTIGASGAIAGVMGAYLLCYPHARVLTLIPLIVIMEMVVLPAPVFLGVWFVLQFFQGVATISTTEASGVAWWAHIGGFVAGLGAAALCRGTHHLRDPVETVRPGTERTTAYRVYPRRQW